MKSKNFPIEWNILLEDLKSRYKIAVGQIKECHILPKLLYIDLHESNLRSNFLKWLLVLTSSFTVYFPRECNLEFRKAKVILSLLANSISMVSSYRFIPVSLTSTAEEHTVPYVIGWLHRRLKTLIINITNKVEVPYDILRVKIDDDSERQSLMTALSVSSLLTTPTRHGGELRQVISQSLLSAIYLLRNKHDEYELYLKLLISLILDTYTWFAHHLKSVVDAYPAELRRLALKIEPLKLNNGHVQFYEKLLNTLQSKLVNKKNFLEFINEAYNTLTQILKQKRDYLKGEYLMGRLWRVTRELEKYKGLKSKVLITIATGQWNISYPILFKELFNEIDEMYVLYTQNTLEQRLLEEEVHRVLEEKYTFPKIHYVPTSATDSIMIEECISNIMKKCEEKSNDAIVIAQGPASIAFKLYHEAKKRKYISFLI